MCPAQSNGLPTRTTIALIVFIGCCLLSSARLVRDASHHQTDHVAKLSDQRFAALKAELPARGVVGYLGEPGDCLAPDYYLTQYALAPLVIDPSPNHPLVVGNFPSTHLPEFSTDFRVVKDFGNGVVLLRHEETR